MIDDQEEVIDINRAIAVDIRRTRGDAATPRGDYAGEIGGIDKLVAVDVGGMRDRP